MVETAKSPRGTKVPEIRTGDQVLVLTGKDAGKRGIVERVDTNSKGWAKVRDTWKRVSGRSEPTVLVGGVNIAKKHTKPRTRQGANDRQPRVQQGGIIEVAQPMSVSKVMIVCPQCGQPTRVRHMRTEAGVSMRICTHCGESLTRTTTTSRGVR